MLQMLTLVTLLITTITVPISSASSEPKTISIAEARSLPLGTIVTIDGSVTVASGAFSSITGTITQPIVNDLPFGFIIFINDGSGEVHSFVCASTGIDVSDLSPGQTVEITGFSGQFANDFEVDPRTQDDIRIVTN